MRGSALMSHFLGHIDHREAIAHENLKLLMIFDHVHDARVTCQVLRRERNDLIVACKNEGVSCQVPPVGRNI